MRTPDVLVVGAGPVGMTAAILLASHGVGVAVVEKNEGTADDPKAISLDDESLRVYQRAGFAADVLGVIVPGTGTRYFDTDDQPLFHGGATVPYRHGFPFKNPFAQPDLERVLRRALEEHPLVDLQFSAEVVSLSQDESSVDAVVRTSDGVRPLRAGYLLAADGGRSTVRTALDIGMTGRSHHEVWLVIDCLDDPHRERYGMHHGDPRRPFVVVPGLHGRCRYEFLLYPGEGDAGPHPSFGLIERLLAPHRPIRPEQVERAVAYKFHGLNADRWRRGRTFLLGDAAHMMPPFAGQGLNSGIRDASNLSWKLAAVLLNGAPDSLLDTYEEERRPHAAAVIRSSERLGRVVMTTNERLARFRDAVVREALSTASGRAYFEGMHYRPTPRISSGVVVDPGGHPLVGLVIGQPTVFDFRRHRAVPLDALLGNGWAVVGVGVDDDDWDVALDRLGALQPSAVDVPVDDLAFDRRDGIQIAIDVDSRLMSEFESARGHFVLIRPDRVVAAVVTATQLGTAVGELLALTSRSGTHAVHTS